jgi:hypothetical protein
MRRAGEPQRSLQECEESAHLDVSSDRDGGDYTSERLSCPVPNEQDAEITARLLQTIFEVSRT